VSNEDNRADVAFTSSEQELRLLVDTIPALVWTAGPEGDIEYVNKRVLAYLGATLDEIIGTGWVEKVHPDDVAFKTKTWLTNLESGTAHDAVCRFRGADGQYRWFAVGGAPLKAGDGRVLRWYGVLIDIDDRRKSEEALRENEYKLRQIIDTVPGPIWSTGPDGSEDKEAEVQPGFLARVRAILNVLPAYTWYGSPSGSLSFVNKRQADFLGVPKDHPLRFGIDIGAPWDVHIPFLHPDDQEKGRKYWANSLRTGEGYEHDYRVRDAQGNYRWLLTRTEPLRASDGTILLWVGATLDIEELKRAEEGLRESEAKIRRLVDANIIGIVIWDFDGRISEANDAFLRMVDYDREDLVAGRIRWTELTPAGWRETDERAVTGLRSTGTFQPFEKEYFRKDGSRVPVLIGLATFEGGGNQGVAFVLDLTERKRAEQALRESERSARSAIDGIPGLVAIVTPNGEIETVNRQCVDYFGRSLEEQKDWVTTNMVHPEDLPHMIENFRRAIASEIPYHFEQRLRRFDGEYRWFDTRGSAVRDDSGRIARWYVLLTDIEDRTRALARLDQMQSDFAHMNRVSTMGELAASLSHEITQPIASARNNARAALNFLNKEAPDLAEIREALACIVADSDRAGQIVDRIRDQTKKAPPRRDRFDLNGAVSEVIALLQGEIIGNRVSVQTRFADEECFVEGDRVQLQQVVMNLILNAIEAMSSIEGGARELLISTEQNQANGVLVALRDSGPGIDPERLERVFEPFYTTKSSGMGMGLSICRSIIDAHGGRLWADAIEPSGTVFQFTVPTVERALMDSDPERQQSEEPHAGIASAASRRRVSEDNRQRHLSRRGPVRHHLDSQ
jgi:PAS domain S-box-containing protein